MGIPVDFAFDRMSNEPIDSSIVLTKAEMLAIDDSSMPDVYFAVCKDDKNMYVYDKSATPSAETGKFKVVEGGGGGEEGKTYTMDWDKDTHELTLTDGTTPQKLELAGLAGQVDTMPTPAAEDEGKIVQYIGATDTNYTNGYFYECVEVTPATDPKTYEWKQKNVQDGGSGGGDANFTLDTTNDFATIGNQTQGIGFELNDANGVTITASEPGTYYNSKILATQDYVDSHSGGAFVLDTANPCSYNELQSAINSAKVILIKHSGNIYPFVEKWESDENTKRYVNIASLQRQAVDKGAMYFFFEATIGDFDSPMAYSSNFAQPTGKPYTDSVTGNLSNLATTEKTNLVGAVNEVNGKLGINFAVGKETWYGTYTDENNVTYQVYTKTVYIPALPATAGITTYNHGVANIKQILSIYGFTTDGFVLNAPRQTTSDNIAIYQASKSASNQTFSIEVGKDRSNKSAYVTMVYAKNN